MILENRKCAVFLRAKHSGILEKNNRLNTFDTNVVGSTLIT